MNKFSAILSAGLILLLAFFLLDRLITGPSVGIQSARKAIAKNDVTQIATAIAAYETEYRHLPQPPPGGRVDADFLAILTGANRELNPRGIVFLYPPPPKARNHSGVKDGLFLDPWGGPYHIAIASGTNTSVIAGTNNITVPKQIAAWNDSNLHPDLKTNDPKARRRYVTSWE